MPQGNPVQRVSFDEVVEAETRYLEDRRKIAGELEDRRPIGLALSGGGVRSATFSLGVLQALSKLELLPKFDYLSTVSGGGYIGSCLTSLLSHRSKPDATIATGGADDYTIGPPAGGGGPAHFGTTPANFPFNPELNQQTRLKGFRGDDQLRHLRTRGDYLVVRSSVLSRDVLRAVGNVLGGLFWHLLIFALFLVGVSAAALAVISAWTGDVNQQLPTLTLAEYVSGLTDWPYTGAISQNPLVLSLLLGFALAVAAVVVATWWCRRSGRTFRNPEGRSEEEQREIESLWLFAAIMVGFAAAFTCAMAIQHGSRIAVIAVPFGIFFGGQAAAIALHACVAILQRPDRNDRSRFAATKGLLNHLSAATFGLMFLPYAIYKLEAPRLGYPSGLVWLLSVGGSWLLAKRNSSAESSPVHGAWTAWTRLSTKLRNAVLGVCVVVLAVGGGVLFDVFLLKLHTTFGRPLWWIALCFGAASLLLFALVGFLDFNKLSLHYFYRDRLVETYLQTYAASGSGAGAASQERVRDDGEMKLEDVHGSKPAGGPAGDSPCASAAPYHLIVTSLNLTASRDMARRDRKSDEFVFSKLYCGSETTGYVPTSKYRGGETKLARVMTISGAAASSAMGRFTFFAEAFALTLFNARLGQWMENPRHKNGAKAHRTEGGVFWPFYLLREMLGSTDARRRLIHLSDGGHTGDNLGIGPLLRRRCAVIVAVDAEADPNYTFGSLCEALRQTYIDFNIKVDLVVDAIRPDPATGRSASHCAIARIRYPKPDSSDVEQGWLIVLKSSLTGDELARLEDYRRANPEFPQQSTADQFFDDDQFESYRELGYHVAKKSLTDVPEYAWRVDRGEAWSRVWESIAG